MIKITGWLLAAGILLTGCTKDGETIILPTPGEEQPPATPLVTVIYDPDGLGDRSYNDLIYKGVEEAAKKYGLRTLQLAPENKEQGLAYLETMFRQIENLNDTVRRLFVTPSIVYDAYIRANNKRLETNPYADLLFMETAKPLDGKGSTFYIDYYGAMYMSGCMVHYAASRFNTASTLLLDVRYLSEDPVGGFKIADSTATRIFNEERHYISGKNVNNVTLVPVCGGAMHAFFRAAKSIVSSYKYVGVDGDMTADKDNCIFSTLKRIDKVMVDYIGMWLNGAMPKHQILGLADGATDVIVGNYTYAYAIKGGLWDNGLNMDSLRQVAIRKEGERYEK